MDAREKLLGITLLVTYRGRNYLLTEDDLGLTRSDNAMKPRASRVCEVAGFEPANDNVPGISRMHVEKRELWLATAPDTFHVLRFPPGGIVDEILSN